MLAPVDAPVCCWWRREVWGGGWGVWEARGPGCCCPLLGVPGAPFCSRWVVRERRSSLAGSVAGGLARVFVKASGWSLPVCGGRVRLDGYVLVLPEAWVHVRREAAGALPTIRKRPPVIPGCSGFFVVHGWSAWGLAAWAASPVPGGGFGGTDDLVGGLAGDGCPNMTAGLGEAFFGAVLMDGDHSPAMLAPEVYPGFRRGLQNNRVVGVREGPQASLDVADEAVDVFSHHGIFPAGCGWC